MVAHGTAQAGRAEACRVPRPPSLCLAAGSNLSTPPAHKTKQKMPANGPGSGPRGKLCGKTWPLPFPADTTFPVTRERLPVDLYSAWGGRGQTRKRPQMSLQKCGQGPPKACSVHGREMPPGAEAVGTFPSEKHTEVFGTGVLHSDLCKQRLNPVTPSKLLPCSASCAHPAVPPAVGPGWGVCVVHYPAVACPSPPTTGPRQMSSSR